MQQSKGCIGVAEIAESGDMFKYAALLLQMGCDWLSRIGKLRCDKIIT